MEDNRRKIRVGITHGDINGIGYEVILKAFSDPTMFELCTPVVYGSPKVDTYHRKAMDIQTNFSIINTADDLTADVIAQLKLGYQHPSGFTRADEHNISAGVVTLAVREENGQLPQEAIGKADRNGGQIAEDQAQHIVRPGHA